MNIIPNPGTALLRVLCTSLQLFIITKSHSLSIYQFDFFLYPKSSHDAELNFATHCILLADMSEWINRIEPR